MTEKTAEQIAAEAAAAAQAAADKKAEAAAAKAAKKAEADKVKAEAKAEKEAKAAAAKAEKEAQAAAAKAAKEAAKLAKEAEKAAKKAPEMPKQNDVRRPRPDTTCGKVWALCESISEQLKQAAPAKNVIDAGTAAGIDISTLRTQYALWKRFHGLSGRITLPVAAPVEGQAASA